jgi:phenylpropionate dioxygenase-like ring-hydroxylating dioxygenase large terminal subunit
MVAEKQDVVWIWVEQKPGLVPDVPQLHTCEESAKRRRQFIPPKLWKCNFVNAVENAIDTTHIPFIHVRTLGSNQRRLYPRQRVIIDTDHRGFSGEDSPESPWGIVRNAQIVDGIWGSLATRALGMRRIRREYYRFNLGGTLFYHIEWDTGAWDILIAHCTPADEFQTWFFGASIRTRATHFLGDLLQSWFIKRLIDEDELAVTQMLSNDSKLLPSPVSVVGDEPTLAFRRIYNYHLNLQYEHYS